MGEMDTSNELFELANGVIEENIAECTMAYDLLRNGFRETLDGKIINNEIAGALFEAAPIVGNDVDSVNHYFNTYAELKSRYDLSGIPHVSIVRATTELYQANLRSAASKMMEDASRRD